MKSPIYALLLASALACTVSCNKASQDSSQAPGSTPGSTSQAAGGTTADASGATNPAQAGSGTAPDGNSAAAGAPATPVQQPVRIPSGTTLNVKLRSAISSASAHPGDSFRAVLNSPLRVNGQTVASSGSEVTGKVVAAEASGRLEHPGMLQIELSSIHVKGQEVEISTSVVTLKGASHAKRNVGWIGGGAAGGAVLGGLMGGGKGALIGSAAGAGAGTATAAATGKHDVAFNAEQQISFRLRKQVEIQ